MRKESIAVAETVLEAQQAACKELGVDTVDAQFEVLQMPEKKRFGIFGGCMAKVRAYIDVEDTEDSTNVNGQGNSGPQSKSVTIDPIDPEELAKIESRVKDWLKTILSLMHVDDLEISSTSSESMGNEIHFDLNSAATGYIIGHKGTTLTSIQYLANLIANTDHNSFIKVTLNVGAYKEKREKNLKILAQKTAHNAVRFRKKIHLKPMNSYERRIIHTSVQQVRGATSWSEGEDPFRHVIITFDPKFRPAQRGYNPAYRKRNNGNYNRNNNNTRNRNNRSGGNYNRYSNNSNYSNNYSNYNNPNHTQRKRPPSYGKLYDSDLANYNNHGSSESEALDTQNKVSNSHLYGKIK